MSTVDAAVAALVAVAGVAAPSAQIIDGPIEGVTVTQDGVIVVGDTEIIGTAEFDSMSSTTTTENYVVPMVASVSLQDTSMSAARNAAVVLYETVKAAIVADPTLGLGLGASFHGFPTGEWSVQQRAEGNGRNAAVRFGVAVMATNT
jgi:hypothetical protein